VDLYLLYNKSATSAATRRTNASDRRVAAFVVLITSPDVWTRLCHKSDDVVSCASDL